MLNLKSLFTKGGSASKLVPYDPDARRFFCRVVTGIAWPGEHPGFVAVVGEEYHPKERRYFWLAEYQSHDLGDLLRRCMELKSELKISDFYGSPDEQVLFFLNHFNTDLRNRGQKEFHFEIPPNHIDGRIAYHLNVLKSCLVPSATRLVLNEQSALPGMLGSLPPGAPDLKAGDAPGPAALAFALSALESYPFNYEPAAPQKDYDVLAYR